MPGLQQELSDLLSDEKEDRFSCPQKTRTKAMDFLARREYGQTELINKLADKGYDRDIVQRAVRELTADGLQSDQRFTTNFIQSRIHQGKGPVRIRLDLRQRGIDSTIVAASLAETDDKWCELAVRTRIKKFGEKQPSDFAAKAKQMRFLQYRGFEKHHIQSAIDGD